MKDKFKNYSFWISVTGAVLLLINNLGKVFGFTVDNDAVVSIVDGFCGVLVVFGILTMNKNSKDNSTTQQSEPLEQQTAEDDTFDDQTTNIND